MVSSVRRMMAVVERLCEPISLDGARRDLALESEVYDRLRITRDSQSILYVLGTPGKMWLLLYIL
jgi:hypothetical protein